MRKVRWTIVPIMLLMGSGTSAAQTPDERSGFWIGFGLGPGNLGCGDCTDEPGGGFSGHFKVGGTPSRKLLVGGEILFWGKEDEDLDATLSYGNASAIIQFYPAGGSGFFLKAGIGVAYSELKLDLGGGQSFQEQQSGFGSSFGTGWDLRVSRNMSITPVLNLSFGSLDDANVALLQLAVGLTWH